MREILFRGKRIDNGEWEYGFYVEAEKLNGKGKEYFIIEYSKEGNTHAVDPSTVGQFTGLTNKNGKKIFEGDIISKKYICNFVVEYSEEDAEYHANFGDSTGRLCTYFNPEDSTVIGNIHDNPELLEVKK